MQEDYLFEYAVIRAVPRVEREEFLNVGVILYCPKPKFLQCLSVVDRDRLGLFSSALDLDELECHIRSFDNICKGVVAGGPIAKLDIASRFRWLTATRSTILQASRVHPGLCSNPAETLSRLFAQLVS